MTAVMARHRSLRVRRLRHAVRRPLRGRAAARPGRRAQADALSQLWRDQAARVHLAARADGPPCRLLAGDRRCARLRAGAHRRRCRAARAAAAGLSGARRLPRGAGRAAPAARGRAQDRDPLQRRAQDARGRPRGAPGSRSCSMRSSRSRRSGSSSRIRRSISSRSTGWRVRPDQIAFQSSNAWDVHGAATFGLRAVWINRQGLPPERLPGRGRARAARSVGTACPARPLRASPRRPLALAAGRCYDDHHGRRGRTARPSPTSRPPPSGCARSRCARRCSNPRR